MDRKKSGRKERDLEMVRETLAIIERGSYVCEGETVSLKADMAGHRKAIVLLESDIAKLKESPLRQNETGRKTVFSVSNRDSYEAALALMRSAQWRSEKRPGKVLVLNFASPVNPGGGVRGGAKAQEEDLCRRSTLLVSLESEEASRFYEYHRKDQDPMASDAMILSPTVEVFRRSDGSLMPEPVTVSVLTCAAPAVSRLDYVPDRESLAEIFGRRIQAMLQAACRYGYRYLVLGAWGCGAFGNDAGMVAEQFALAFQRFQTESVNEKGVRRQAGAGECFRHVEFAVLDETGGKYNYNCFAELFGDRRHAAYAKRVESDAEKVLEEKAVRGRFLDAVRGCLVGGAIGDALGYPVEFWSEKKIRETFGEGGITSFQCRTEADKAVVSDDTQMTMFTATGILQAYTRGKLRGIMGPVSNYVYEHYLDWLRTQQREEPAVSGASWLRWIPELYVRRAPGNTCMGALVSGKCGSRREPLNHSKGCGGVMRVSPIALCLPENASRLTLEELYGLDLLGADAAAITHGHPLAYIPAAALVHIINRIVYGGCTLGGDLYAITAECREAMEHIFAEAPERDVFLNKMDEAVCRSRNSLSDSENIRALGEGWVGDEAFAVALYSSLRHSEDFSAAIVCAVNHDGDSDSTGAITGNIVGALAGHSRIDVKWKQQLEFHWLLVELADDLTYGCPMSEYSTYWDEDWYQKYMAAGRPASRGETGQV